MIPQIKEIEGKFPKYATLSQATVTLNDMGDKTISTQIKIDGGIAPDFSYDWEVEFQGERYIQPLREPQASKGNESICSVIDLTFYHKTIYDLKRYFFVEMASTGSGTAMADKYIADLNVNLEQFKVALQEVLDYYHEIGYSDEPITVKLYGEGEGIYAQEPQYVQIQYTHIWDVVQKIYDLFGVRWSIEGREIKIGYPTEEVAHTFEYGFEGGLLKVERQVQSADIRNSLLGRGGSKNLPYLYFKDLDKYGETAENGTWTPDPDAIPELRSIYFTELRGKTFRDYVQGWKTNPNRDLSYGDVVEEYDEARGESPEGWAYKAGHEDKTFNPIEFVKDDDSIAKYELLQGGLENQEGIYPTIQGVEVDGLGRVDEIVEVDEVKVDEVDYTSNITHSYEDRNVTKTFTITKKGTQQFEIISEPFSVAQGMIGDIYAYLATASMVATGKTKFYDFVGGIEYSTTITSHTNIPIECKIESFKFYNYDSNEELLRLDNLTQDIKIYYKAIISNTNAAYRFNNSTYTSTEFGTTIDPNTGLQITYPYDVTHDIWYEFEPDFELSVNTYVPLYQIQFGGDIIPNTKDDEPISGSAQLSANGDATLVLDATDIVVEKDRTTLLDIPIRIDAYKSGDSSQNLKGSVEYRKHIILSNKETGELVNGNNLSAGEYFCRVEVECHNNANESATFVATLLPTYLLPPTDSEEWQPTFDIWVKNIWNTTRNEGESAEAYVERVWTPILGDREGNEAKVVFTTGWLAGHSDYEFKIVKGGVAYDNSEILDGVTSEWRLTLAKSDAELEATGKWIPSTTQQANKGDKFFFIGIDMPHEYTLWAEQAIDNYKADQLIETAHIKPTWVVQTDKVRLNQLQEGESELLLNALKIGNSLRLADTRFTNGVAQTLYLQSVTYTWQEGTNIVPDVEVVLSDKVTTSTNPVAKLQGEVDALTKQVGSISNIQQVVRAIGDKLYLRKDGFEEVSNSPTEFNKLVSSRGYRQGAVGGNGWGLRSEQGKGIFEVDKLIVRDEMQVNSLVVNQVSAIGGKEILSAASITCSRVENTEQGFKCYFDQKRGSVANLFVVNDIAYSQVFNANDIEVKYYKREVIEVGDNYILLSLEGDGSGAPQVGDVIAQYGNTADTSRQYIIIRDVIGGGYERMLSDLNSASASGTEYYFAGRLEGGTPRWFVGNADGDHAEWKDGTLNIKGKLAVGSDVGGATVVEGGLVTAETIALGGDVVKSGITGVGDSDDDVRIWAGTTEDNKDNAPFRVQQNGKVVATNAEIAGTVNANSGTFDNGIFNNVTVKGSQSSPIVKFEGTFLAVYDINNDENLNYYRASEADVTIYFAWRNELNKLIFSKTLDIEEGFNNFYSVIGNGEAEKKLTQYQVVSTHNELLGKNGVGKHDNLVVVADDIKYIFAPEEIDWSLSNNGRVIRIIDKEYNGQTSSKPIKLNAPDGKYFFEDGEKYSSLIISNEIVEFLGVGTDSSFDGWLVISRKNILTNNSYGSAPNVLYQGIVRDGVLKVWTPMLNRGAQTISAGVDNGSIWLSMGAYRGLSNLDNWEVFATNAYVTDKAINDTSDMIGFRLVSSHANGNYYGFQVVSTADWETVTATTNE